MYWMRIKMGVFLSNGIGKKKDGVVKNIYVLDLSRLSRSPFVSSQLRLEMERHEVKLFTDSSELDFGSEESTLIYDFMSSINQFFVRVQRKKSMRGLWWVPFSLLDEIKIIQRKSK